MALLPNAHYEKRGSWDLLHGNPLAYLKALQSGANRDTIFPAGRFPKAVSKYEFDLFVTAQGGRAPRTFGLVVGGEVSDNYSAEKQTLGAFLRKLPRGHYFCKPDNASQGTGAMHLEISPGCVKINGGEKDMPFLENTLSACPYLVQEWLVPRQHRAMARFNPAVINSVRLVTFDTQPHASVVTGLFRSAMESTSVDNWTAGGVATWIDVARGELAGDGIIKRREGFFPAHPVSGVSFAGQPIPYFREAVTLVQNLQARLAARSIGWDLAVLEDGPVVMESNRGWDILVAGYYEPEFTGKFLAFHLSKPEQGLTLEFQGEFPDRDEILLFVCKALGKSRLSGRLDHFSREEFAVTVAGSPFALRTLLNGIARKRFHTSSRTMTARRSAERIPPGLDVSIGFSEERTHATG